MGQLEIGFLLEERVVGADEGREGFDVKKEISVHCRNRYILVRHDEVRLIIRRVQFFSILMPLTLAFRPEGRMTA